MTARLLHEEARLRSLFQRLVAVTLATAPVGCSSGDTPPATDAGSASDATVLPTGDAAGGDATTSSLDAGPDSGDDASSPRDAVCDPVYVDGEADGSGCDFFEHLACNLAPGTPTEGCAIFLVTCTQICGQVEGFPCAVVDCDDAGVIASGPITVECTTGKVGCADGGRRPGGLQEPQSPGSVSALGEWLARLAWMEAASVHAFRVLGEELAELGAPASLVRAAERARRDEVNHARLISRLAKRHGARRARATVTPRRARSVEAFARENAVEGCVREAFAALLATWQARRAPDADLTQAMTQIAADETRHAALALAIAGWVDPKLSPTSRREVRTAMRGALRALRCELASVPAPLARDAGLPTPAEGTALLDGFASALLA